MDPERRRQMMERLQALPPGERERIVQRMRERSGDSGPGEPARSGARELAAESGAPVSMRAAQTIDSLFGPLPPTESAGQVWLYAAGQLEPIRVRLGVTDGGFTELLSDDLEAGVDVVTGVITGREAQAGAGRGAQGARSPLMPQPRMPGPRR
jgi:hypothetical protein